MADVNISRAASGAATGDIPAPAAPVTGIDSPRNTAGVPPAAPVAETAKPDVPGALQAAAAVQSAVKDANLALAAIGTQLVFVFDDQDHHLAVKLLDVQTQKVVKEIPSTAMPATASALSERSANGALVNTKA